MEETQTPTLSNREVAVTLGLSESGVSRLRSGDRLPSLDLMIRIQAAYAWTVQEQADARAAASWTRSFEARLAATARDKA